VAIYISAKALSRWPINDESTLTQLLFPTAKMDRLNSSSGHMTCSVMKRLCIDWLIASGIERLSKWGSPYNKSFQLERVESGQDFGLNTLEGEFLAMLKGKFAAYVALTCVHNMRLFQSALAPLKNSFRGIKRRCFFFAFEYLESAL
jgi:hypothetical protein